MSSSTIELIKKTLSVLRPTQLDVIDDRAQHIGHANQDSGHFTVIIQSPLLDGKNALTQHRMIYATLGSLMQTHIHALSIQIK